MRLPIVLLIAVAAGTETQATPSSGQLLSEAQRQFPAIYLPSVGYRDPSAVSWTLPEDEGPGLTVKGFRFDGNQRISDQQLQQAFSLYASTNLTPRQIYSLTDLVKQLYAAMDLAVSAKVPPQDVEDGIVLFQIREAEFAGVELDYGFEDSFNVELEQIEAIAGAGVLDRTLPRLSEMQRGQLLAIDLHGVAVSGGNHPDEDGNQMLELWVENTPTYSGTVELNNAGNPETGEAQVRLTSLYASPFARGGATYINALKSESANFASLAYRGPVGLQGATIDLQLGLFDYSTSTDNDNAQSYSIGYRYPIVRSVPANLFVTALAERRDLGYLLDTFDLTFDGNRAFKVGRLTYSAQLATGSADSAALDKEFSKFAGFLNFSQRYSNGWRYNARLSGQLSDSDLDDAERIILGGPEGLRGYSSEDGLADQGLMLNLDLQKQISDRLRLGVFYDAATVRPRESDGQTIEMTNIGLSSRFSFEGGISLTLSTARALNDSLGSTESGDQSAYLNLSVPF